jgi:hypothetical protein
MRNPTYFFHSFRPRTNNQNEPTKSAEQIILHLSLTLQNAHDGRNDDQVITDSAQLTMVFCLRLKQSEMKTLSRIVAKH